MVVLVVTATTGPDGTAESANTAVVTANVTAAPSANSPTPQASQTPNVFPTDTLGQIPVAEQVFERGRMFWIQPLRQIWVMLDDGSGAGKWLVFEDTYQEGEAESDPSIIPPAGMYQPERGFGKLWRTNQEVNDALGFGLTPEFGYVSNYEYHPGGSLSERATAIPPGYHILFSLYQEQFRFDEAGYTWQKLQ
jgi:hypothetical protein